MHPILVECLNAGVLTGSRALKCHKSDSDWDIVLTESAIPKSLDNIEYDVCATLQENCEPYEADGIDSLQEMYEGTIWGPINRIVKYYLFEEDGGSLVILNLFIYPDKEQLTVAKFHQVNAFMMFSLTQQEREHKPTRVTKFKEILKNLNIT